MAIGLALVHVFITFRGLSSASGMEHAQFARELARGHGFQNKVIRPYAWARLNAADKDPSPVAMPEITQPPLQPLLWTPVFKMLECHLPYEPTKTGAIFDTILRKVGLNWQPQLSEGFAHLGYVAPTLFFCCTAASLTTP